MIKNKVISKMMKFPTMKKSIEHAQTHTNAQTTIKNRCMYADRQLHQMIAVATSDAHAEK